VFFHNYKIIILLDKNDFDSYYIICDLGKQVAGLKTFLIKKGWACPSLLNFSFYYLFFI